jgi:hypothetical protein
MSIKALRELDRKLLSKEKDRQIEILTAQRDELLAALRALYGWTKAEVEHFGATCPDDFIVEMVEKALGGTK